MNGSDVGVAAIAAAAVLLVTAAALIAVSQGWIEGSLSLRFVPPWKRKAPAPRKSAVAQEPGAADVIGPPAAAPVPPARRLA